MSFELVGDVTLLHRFHQLSNKMQRTEGRKAVAKAARNLVARAKVRAPVLWGFLQDSLGFRPRTYRNNYLAIVGPRDGFLHIDANDVRRDPKKYAHLVEWGHGGPHPADPDPFLLPAFDETEQENLNIMLISISDSLMAEASARHASASHGSKSYGAAKGRAA